MNTRRTKASMGRLIGMVILIAACRGSFGEAKAQRLYWRGGRTIYSSNLDGSGIESFDVSHYGFSSAGDIAIDSVRGKVYWTENYQEGQILRANLDGSSPEYIVDRARALSIAIDESDARIYWTVNMSGTIMSADLDGGNVEESFQSIEGFARDLAVDSTGRRVCWPASLPFSIQCGDLETGGVEVVIHGGFAGSPDRIAMDSMGGRVYWTGYTGRLSFIQSANLDGSDVRTDQTVFGSALDIVANEHAAKLIWILFRLNEDHSWGILQSNFDGSGVEEVHRYTPGMAYRLALNTADIMSVLDIKPGACPNVVNPRSRGLVPAALAGMETFDVAGVDLDSVALRRADGTGDAIAPAMRGRHLMAHTADVTAPRDGAGCECQESHPDGLLDLVLHFSAEEMTEAFGLDALSPGESLELALTGQLLDGTYFRATDCMTIPGRRAEPRHERGLRVGGG